MPVKTITGFHAIEERVLKTSKDKKSGGMQIFWSKQGPRVKKILSAAKEAGIPCIQQSDKELDAKVSVLSPENRDHRGIVLLVEEEGGKKSNLIDFNNFICSFVSAYNGGC